MKTTVSFQLLTILLVSTALTGCMTPGKNIIPQGGDMTMADIYKQETGLEDSTSPMDSSEPSQASTTIDAQQSLSDDPNFRANPAQIHGLPETHYAGFVEEGSQSINALYKPFPNPEIGMYVYPHLITSDGESFIKPGMNTAFFMFKDNAMAMPGEIY